MKETLKKIVMHPVVDVILTFIIAYLLMEKSYLLDNLLLTIPYLLGINLPSILGEDLYATWIVYFLFIDVWILGLIIISVLKNFRPILKAFSPKLKGNNIKSALIWGSFFGFGLNIIVVLVAIITGSVKIHYVGINLFSFLFLLVAVFIQCGAEELVARALIYQKLRKNFPKLPIIAILGNGIFFMAIHLSNPGISLIPILTLLAVSVLYSLIVYYFDSLWIPIIAHTTWNFTQSIILGLPNSGLVFPVSMFKIDAATENFAFDPFFGIEGAILTLIISIISAICVYYFGRKKGALETNIWL